jgi:hypothetical protein
VTATCEHRRPIAINGAPRNQTQPSAEESCDGRDHAKHQSPTPAIPDTGHSRRRPFPTDTPQRRPFPALMDSSHHPGGRPRDGTDPGRARRRRAPAKNSTPRAAIPRGEVDRVFSGETAIFGGVTTRSGVSRTPGGVCAGSKALDINGFRCCAGWAPVGHAPMTARRKPYFTVFDCSSIAGAYRIDCAGLCESLTS